MFRRSSGRRPSDQAALLLANLPETVAALEEARVRVRRLPIVEHEA
jgi:hypothetical protein